MCMRNKLIWLGGLGLVSALACEKVAFPTPAPDEEFTASLSGAEEVPAVSTPATASARFAVSLDTFLAFRLDVETIDSTTLAHIHAGEAGVPGPVIVTLFVGPATCTSSTATSPRCRPEFSGQLALGQFKPSQLADSAIQSYGATPRERFDSLLALMRIGGVYVNVHNRANPGGHVRGQVGPRP
jgi:hypothetical protein